MREINEAGLLFIEGFEEFRPITYLDIAGNPTIGYGHLIRPGEDFSGGLTRDQALELLRIDLRSAYRSVLTQIKVSLTDNQYAALVSFTFNAGGGSLKISTLKRLVNARDYIGASNEFVKWNKAGRPLRPSKGLTRRRLGEKQLFLS